MQFKKYFTPSEATRTLPLVRRIVEDILETATTLRTTVTQDKQAQDTPEVEALKREIVGYFEELRELGCEYRDWDYTAGLVDFPAVINGEVVMLCWRSDEPELKYYHRIEEGYAGRRPIPLEYYSEVPEAKE